MADIVFSGVNFTGGFTVTLPPPNIRAIFGFGNLNNSTNVTNLVSNTGVVATDTAGVGTGRYGLAAASFGSSGQCIFGYGYAIYPTHPTPPPSNLSLTNIVSNTGVVATDTAGVGTARSYLAAAGYGTDKALFGYGETASAQSITNLVSNTGVVSANVTGVGLARRWLAAAGYGTDKAIFGYGYPASDGTAVTNLVSNTGVVSTDVTGVGTARRGLAAAGYGSSGQAIFGYGNVVGSDVFLSMTNKVSNAGVVATDTTGVGTARGGLSATMFGTSGQAIFGYGYISGPFGRTYSLTNLISNTGVVATDTTGVGSTQGDRAAATYGS